ncbi:hypothetical protein [Micromonospora chersina]|uniref:hypothetical protein n=1 Tax=Micromonospora chersina TaxID=47854 RepID=UPI00340887AB
MTQPKTNRIPAPVYAAAGAGELALQQLRKLPTVVSDLGTRVVADLGGKAVVTGFELRQKATETLKTANLTATGLREKAGSGDLDLDKLREAANLDKLREAANLDKLREAAGRNAAVVLAGAQAAQERALAAYAELVARGERVVGAGVLEAADTVNADIEATEADTTPAAPATPAPAAAAPAAVPTPAEVAEVVEAKPAAVKRTRAKATAAKATAAKATPSAKLPKTTKRTRPTAE